MAPPPEDKYRVRQVLTRLASKDTHAGAAVELEKIVRVREVKATRGRRKRGDADAAPANDACFDRRSAIAILPPTKSNRSPTQNLGPSRLPDVLSAVCAAARSNHTAVRRECLRVLSLIASPANHCVPPCTSGTPNAHHLVRPPTTAPHNAPTPAAPST